MAYLAAFPNGSTIVSGKRSIDQQAQADAKDVVQVRDFISNVYVPSPVRDAMAAVCKDNPEADIATLATLFAACLGQFTADELSFFSLHVSGDAVDLEPVGDPEREAWCQQFVAQHIVQGGSPRSRVLTKEDGEIRLHVQIL